MGKAKAKGKRFTLTNKNDDPATGEDEKILAQKRKGRPQKPLTDDEDVEKIEEQEDADAAAAAADDENSISDVNEKKRKRNKGAKEKDNLVKKESPNGTRSNGFRHIGSRRKNKPHRAAEVGVECK